MPNSAAPTLDVIAGSRERILGVCSELGPDDWRRPAPVPGWDVQDVVAHLGSLEALLLGRPEPPHRAADLTHVRNPLGELNEHLVDRRRSWTPGEVLAEFAQTTQARLDALRGLDEEGLEEQVLAPTGRMIPLRDFLGVRVWDYFVHELDIAAALDRALPLDTDAADRVLGEMLAMTPRAVAKAGAPEGAVVVIELVEPRGRSAAARMEGDRGVPTAAAAGEATLHLRASPAAFVMVAAGRRSPDSAGTADDLAVEGDLALARRILGRLNVMP